jgi:chitinase
MAEQYVNFNSIKALHAGLKTLIAVGGWNFDQKRFVAVSSTKEKRAAFAASVVTFLERYGFDGIELDWVSDKACCFVKVFTDNNCLHSSSML